MSQFLRNPEIRRELILEGFLALVCGLVGYVLLESLLPFGVALVFVALHVAANWRRYRRLAELSEQIDQVLHGKENLNLARYEEGELAILSSEIYKMTVRLRDTAQILERDKRYLSDSLADISHQLRTPLTAMNLTVSMLSKANLPQAQRLELAHKMRGLLVRVDWLVEGLLKLSRIDAGTVRFQPEWTPVARLLQKAAEPLAIPMELRGQTLRTEVGEERVFADVSWTMEAIGNLLKNCVEHTPENGTITARVRETSIFVQLTICDTGPGFAPEDLPHLFERFYRGKNAGSESVGIGLALCRSVLRAQNATVKASQGKTGAEFTVRFYKSTV